MDFFFNPQPDGFFTWHLQPLPRAFAVAAPVLHIGYIPAKRDEIDRPFPTMNYSFILSGTGVYELEGRTWAVRSPAVITQWPGRTVRYRPHRTWEELYILYEAKELEGLTARGLARAERPVWHVHDPGAMRRYLAELRDALADAEGYGGADRIDRICQSLIQESWIGEARAYLDESEEAIRKVQSILDSRFLEDLDLDELALDAGFSPSTFRRHWARFVGVPPARYVRALRLRQACRLLVETRAGVGEIAARLGFDDPLYFSRAFRAFAGLTATEYRCRHQAPLSLRGGGGSPPPVSRMDSRSMSQNPELLRAF